MSTVNKKDIISDFSFLNELFFNLWRDEYYLRDKFFTGSLYDLYPGGEMEALLNQLNLSESDFEERYIHPFSNLNRYVLKLLAKAITVKCGGQFEMTVQGPPEMNSLNWSRAQILSLGPPKGKLKGRLPGFHPIPFAQDQPGYIGDWNHSSMLPFKQCLYCGNQVPHWKENKKDYFWFCHSANCDHSSDSHAYDCHMRVWRNEKDKIIRKLQRQKTQEDAGNVFKEFFESKLKENQNMPDIFTEVDDAKAGIERLKLKYNQS